jgi:decaprenyl-phosphate phosphoribosyltransferase
MSRATLRGHLAIMRADHWFKNVFVLPGTAVALSLVPAPDLADVAWRLGLGLVAICLTASSYYTLNELLDAPFDKFHPQKSSRPVPAGLVNVRLGYVQWLALGALSMGLGAFISRQFAVTLGTLWVMGCLYNIPPIRTKDLPYLDVLSESLNNPLRMLAGWYVVDSSALPPGSLLMSYWMIGGFFMALKRYAEYRSIGDKQQAIAYRKSFRYYDESKLLTSAVFYAAASMLCLGAFMMRYRLELLLAFPGVGAVVSNYFRLGLAPNSPVQTPEKLYRDARLMTAVVVCSAMLVALMFYDVPELYELLAPQLHR